jgi:hypothetical protein
VFKEHRITTNRNSDVARNRPVHFRFARHYDLRVFLAERVAEQLMLVAGTHRRVLARQQYIPTVRAPEHEYVRMNPTRFEVSESHVVVDSLKAGAAGGHARLFIMLNARSMASKALPLDTMAESQRYTRQPSMNA